MSMDAAMLRTSFVLAVPDAEVTGRWWVETMGFAYAAKPEGWVFVRRGACTLMLGSCPDAIPPRDLGDHQYFGYIEVGAIDRLYQDVRRRGADILFAPKSQPWGMREMGVRTPDGHRVMFAERLEP